MDISVSNNIALRILIAYTSKQERFLSHKTRKFTSATLQIFIFAHVVSSIANTWYYRVERAQDLGRNVIPNFINPIFKISNSIVNAKAT